MTSRLLQTALACYALGIRGERTNLPAPRRCNVGSRSRGTPHGAIRGMLHPGRCRVLIALVLFPLVGIDANGAPYAYITTLSNDVSVIDTSSNVVIAKVEIGWPTLGVAVHPTGARVYVGRYAGRGGISVIDTATNSVAAEIDFPFSAYGVAINAQGTRVYASDFVANQVRVIDTATNAVTAIVPVCERPTGVAVSPDSRRVYVACGALDPVTSAGTLWVIDAGSDTVSAKVNLGVNGSGIGVAVHPNGSRVYVGSGGGSLSVIDTNTNTMVARVPLGLYVAYGVAVNPSGTRIYVTGWTTYTGGGQVSAVDATTNNLIAAVPTGNSADGVSFHPDGIRLYVANRFPGTVSIIDTRNNSILAVVPVPGDPIAFGTFIAPNVMPSTASQVPGLSRWGLMALILLVASIGLSLSRTRIH